MADTEIVNKKMNSVCMKHGFHFVVHFITPVSNTILVLNSSLQVIELYKVIRHFKTGSYFIDVVSEK